MASDEDVADQSVVLANAIEHVIEGEPTGAVYLALGMILGAMESKAERPNLCRLMEIISGVAHDQMKREIASRRQH
jgi:hypothetical protein